MGNSRPKKRCPTRCIGAGQGTTPGSASKDYGDTIADAGICRKTPRQRTVCDVLGRRHDRGCLSNRRLRARGRCSSRGGEDRTDRAPLQETDPVHMALIGSPVPTSGRNPVQYLPDPFEEGIQYAPAAPRGAFLLTWNPAESAWDQYQDGILETAEGRPVPGSWSTARGSAGWPPVTVYSCCGKAIRVAATAGRAPPRPSNHPGVGDRQSPDAVAGSAAAFALGLPTPCCIQICCCAIGSPLSTMSQDLPRGPPNRYQ